jgi:hypothetical protein
MSTPSVEGAPPKKPAGKKYAGLTRTQWIIAGVVFAAAVGYLLWRRHEASAAAASTANTASATSDCTDGNGNSIPCSDQTTGGAGDLSSLEDELDSLLSGEAAAGGGGTAATGTTGTTGTTTGTTTTGTSSSTSTATAAGGPITAIPSGLHTTMVSKNSAQIQWEPVTPPAGQGPLTGYSVACYDSSGKTVNGPFKVTTTVANIGGLKAGTAYHANVWADPASTGGPHATVSFTTKKT